MSFNLYNLHVTFNDGTTKIIQMYGYSIEHAKGHIIIQYDNVMASNIKFMNKVI